MGSLLFQARRRLLLWAWVAFGTVEFVQRSEEVFDGIQCVMVGVGDLARGT